MNHIYRVVYNAATNTYQAVPENSTGKHKTASEKSSCAVSDVSEKGAFFSLKPIALCAMAMGLSSTGAWAAPTGGHISAGDASIAQHGKITNIQQNSQKAAINWQSFGIKADETVNFKQPNAQAVILNRVIGNEKSVIDGTMNANGKVFISNPNGMIIGKNAQINVGALLATTAKIKDQDFMNGLFKFDQATGDITQLGDIKVPTGGVVALIAPIVANKGNITAPQGKVLLASAEQFSITLPDNGQFAYTLDRGTLQGLVDNGGAILADGGHVILTAKGTDTVKKSLIKHTGKIEANTVQNKNGVIELLGDLDNTRLEASGSLKAEAEQGDGGFVETSAAELGINDLQVSTQSKYGKTGTWLIDPKDFTVAPSGGDITGKKVAEGLQTNNITLKSRDGAKEGKGDVIINDEISWNKNTLTLNAESDIHINKTLNGKGTAKLALEYGQGTADGGQSDYHIKNGAKVNLPEGKNFTTKKGNIGQTVEFDVIHTMPEISSDGKGKDFAIQNIAFGKDMDLSYTENHNGFSGWGLKKKNNSGDLAGGERIHGLGHTVQNLTLDAPNQDIVGLFRKAEKAELRDLKLRDAKVKGGHDVGVLAGSLINSQVNNIHVDKSSIVGGRRIGGVIGYVETNQGTNSQIANLYSNVKINASEGGSVGGAIGAVVNSGYEPTVTNISNATSAGDIRIAGGGMNTAGTGGLIGSLHIPNSGHQENKISVSNSSATGNVFAPNARGIGGLIGHIENAGNRQIVVQNSFATGKVDGSYDTGGLIGLTHKATIANNYATGNVSGYRSGGLVGSAYNNAVIQNSYAKGNLKASSANNELGGLVGYANQIQIKRSYATGNIAANGKEILNNNSVIAGGLVGNNWDSDISESYATGHIRSTDFDLTAGGLVGKHRGGANIENSYATGDVSGTGWYPRVGGAVGEIDAQSTVSNVYTTGKLTVPDAQDHSKPQGLIGYYPYGTDKPLAGISGSYFNKEAVGTDKDFAGGKAITTAEMQNKATFENWDFNKIWYINDGETPKLHAHKKGTVVINPVTPPTNPNPPANPTNPTPTPVNKTDLAVQANNLNKVYDGKSVATESDLRAIATQNGYTDIVTISGLKNGDSVDKLGTLRYDGAGNTWQNAKNAGAYTIMPSGLTGGQDYEIKYGEGSLTIDKRPVKFTLAGEKQYDGKDTVAISVTTNKTNQEGILDKDLDKVTIQGTGTLTGKNAGIQQLKSVSNTLIGGELGGNYKVSDEIVGRWVIHKRPVELNLSGEKVYDGTNVISVLEKANASNQKGILDSELNQITFRGTGLLTGTNAGTHQLQGIDENVISGEWGKNYEISKVGGQWQINKKPISITASRIYDGTNHAISEETDNKIAIADLRNKLVTADKKKLSSDDAVTIVGQGTLSTKNAGNNIKVSDIGTLKAFALTPSDKAIMDNYEIDFAKSHWELKPAELTVTAVSDTKVYDGTQKSNKKPIITGLKGNDRAEFEQRFDDKNVWGENQSEISVTNGKITDSSKVNNYFIFTKKAKGTIKPKIISIIANKVYDGAITVNANRIDKSDLETKIIQNDIGNISLGGTLTVSDKNAGKDKKIISSENLQLFNNNSLMRNYKIDNQNSKVTIDKRPINLVLTKKEDGSKKVEWGFSKLNGVELAVSNVVNGEIGTPSIGNFVVETSSSKAGYYIGNSEVKLQSDIEVLNSNYIFDPKESSIGVDILNKKGKSVVPDSEKPIKVIEEENPIFFGEKIDLIIGAHYNGFDIGERRQKVYPDGSVNLTMPIYNTMDTTLEIQILDRYGNVVGRKYAEPQRPESSMFDSFVESGVGTIESFQGKRTIQNVSTSERTDIDITIPAGGSVRFTYDSKYAKVYNFIDPVIELILEALPDGDEEEAKKLATRILEQMVKDGSEELLVQTLKAGLNVFTEQGRQNTKLVVELIANTAMELATVDGVIGFTLDIVDVEKVAKKLFGKVAGGSVYALKELAELIVTSLNTSRAMHNYNVNYSKYDVVLLNMAK